MLVPVDQQEPIRPVCKPKPNCNKARNQPLIKSNHLQIAGLVFLVILIANIWEYLFLACIGLVMVRMLSGSRRR